MPKCTHIQIQGSVSSVAGFYSEIYKGLQSIPAGGVWQESFWVKPEGFR